MFELLSSRRLSETGKRVREARLSAWREGRLDEYGQSLEAWIDTQNQSDVFLWSIAAKVAPDNDSRERYISRMVECIREGGAVRYAKGIFEAHFTHSDSDLKKQLVAEFIQKHPIIGRLHTYLPPGCFYSQ